jgi:hypothetical protein
MFSSPLYSFPSDINGVEEGVGRVYFPTTGAQMDLYNYGSVQFQSLEIFTVYFTDLCTKNNFCFCEIISFSLSKFIYFSST